MLTLAIEGAMALIATPSAMEADNMKIAIWGTINLTKRLSEIGGCSEFVIVSEFATYPVNQRCLPVQWGLIFRSTAPNFD